MLHIDFIDILPMFLVMLVLAATPGVSVLTVCARTVSYGFAHGVMVTLGIVSGDIVFILIAVFGLAVMVETMGHYFFIIQLAAGLYLLWLALGLMKHHPQLQPRLATTQSGLFSSYLSGLMVTLPDQKAILFYLGLFPAFVDLGQLGLIDICVVVIMTALAIGCSKLAYAYFADQMRVQISTASWVKYLYYMAAALLVGVGLFLLLTAVGLF